MAFSQVIERIRSSRFLHLLGDASPRNLFVAQILSQIGDKIWLVAVLWYLTNVSTRLAPWFLAASALPHLLMVPFAPRLIRRLGGELQTVVQTDLIRGVFFLFFGLLFLKGVEKSIPILFFLSLLSNTMGSLFNPAILSLPRLISVGEERLQSTTSLIESCFSLSAVLGPLLATALFIPFGLEGILILTGVGYLFAAFVERYVKTHAGIETEEAKSVRPSDPIILWMLIGFFAMNLFLGPVMAFLPLFAKEIYGGSIGSLASLEFALGLGTLLGTLMLTVWPSEGSLERKILIGLVVIASAYFVFCSSEHIAGGILGLLALGFSLALTNVWILNLFQTRPKTAEVLKVMSWVNLISVASLPLSMSLVALILPFISVKTIAITLSFILMLGTCTMYLLFKRKFA